MRSLWLGVRLIRWGLWGWLAITVAAILIAVPWYFLGGDGEAALTLIPLAAVFGFLFVIVCIGVGLWLMASPDPGVTDEPRWSPRRLVRIGVAGAAVCLAGAFGVWIAESAIQPGAALLLRATEILMIILLHGALVFAAVHLHGFGRHTALIARRVNDRRSAVAGSLLGWVGAPFAFIYTVLMTLTPFTWSSDAPETITLKFLFVFAGLAMWLVLILYCGQIDRLRRHVSHCIVQRQDADAHLLRVASSGCRNEMEKLDGA
ncbi:MAG: hypothetical protein EA376_09085 [Phycisphaeraceae bacterium]|nr:MAG: hypothetical protein EA376_09085 [Phycisphaeraceae bacterium]